jgi:hypothetical protein
VTKAYFENIKTHIIEELKKANSSIIVAVAWFTDNDLFEILCQNATKGVNVELIIANDEININSSINYDRINQCGGYFSFDKNDNPNSLMHNKFCLIDLNKTITGSYNWSYKARNNRENITITSDSSLALQFARQFYKLKYGDSAVSGNQTEKEENNLAAYLKRILKLIENRNFNDIDSELFIIKNLVYSNEEVKFITILLTNKQWKSAELSINEYFKLKQQIVLYEDLELKSLLFHKESLEVRFDKLLIEKDDIEKKIFQFGIEYSQRLGKILLELSELYSKYHLSFNGAYGETDDSINEALKTTIPELNLTEKEEIKSLYKKAALICHPDKVDKILIKEAEETFKQLNTAYKNNDIEEVKRIYNNLKTNNLFEKGKEYNAKKIMHLEINKLLQKINKINIEINKLKITSSYQVIQKVFDWDLFYKLEEEKIINEIKSIENEFSKKIFFKKRKK